MPADKRNPQPAPKGRSLEHLAAGVIPPSGARPVRSTEADDEQPASNGKLPIEPLCISVENVARALAIGDTLARDLIARGIIKSITLGRRRVVPVSALRRFVESQLASEEAC